MGRHESRPRQRRLIALGLVFMTAWISIGWRLVQVQAVDAGELASQSRDQRLRRVVLAADRGTIYDRDGRELAVSVDAVTVYANPREISDPVAAAHLLAKPLGMRRGELARLLAKDSSFVYLARKLERSAAQPIRDLELGGIYFLTEAKRVYPAGNLAAQVLGFVGTENRGLEGVEFQYDETLAGTPGEVLFERDGSAAGDVIIPQGQYQEIPPEPGTDVTLTIDAEIQFFAEQVLADWVLKSGATAGYVVAIDPQQGAVLAMANYPSFDPNDVGAGRAGSIRNRAVTDTFEPGSTQKLISVAAAIEEGIVSPTTTFTVPDSIEVFDRTYEDYREHEPQRWTVADIVGHSSNVGTILIWEKLGNELFYRYLQGFGLGTSTGVDFPGEASGVLRPVTEWCESCGASTSIGYRVAVTPLQMTSVYAAVAADGLWREPALIAAVGDEAAGTARDERRVLSEETAATVRLLLEKVVVEGTGTQAAVPGFRVGGKTGTTRKFVQEEGAYGDDVVASFIGLAPVDDPRLVLGVFIDAPQVLQLSTGGSVAAPAFAEIMQFAMSQMGVASRGG